MGSFDGAQSWPFLAGRGRNTARMKPEATLVIGSLVNRIDGAVPQR
jgi:hypothetical protein